MTPRPRFRVRGGRYPTGKTKIGILTYVFDHPDGVKRDDVRRFLIDKFGIIEPDTLDYHMDSLVGEVGKGYIQMIQPSRQDDPIYYPTSDIKKFKDLWLDVTHIWRNADLIQVSDFISTKQVLNFIEHDIVPTFLDLPVSKTSEEIEPFEGNELYANLPHNDLYQNPQFEQVCIWAFKSCPLLITHVFQPNKQVLLCLSMTLQRSLKLPEVKRSLSSVVDLSPQEVSENFARIAEYIRDDWYKIRFSTRSVSKELICILTMIICFYIYLERDQDREHAKSYYTDENYLALWGQYLTVMRDLSEGNPEILMDAMKIVFIISLTDQLFRENPLRRRIPPNEF